MLGPSLIDHSTNLWPFCILENDACSPMPVYKLRYPDSTLWTQGMCDLGAESNGCALVTGFTDPPPPCLNEAPEVCVESFYSLPELTFSMRVSLGMNYGVCPLGIRLLCKCVGTISIMSTLQDALGSVCLLMTRFRQIGEGWRDRGRLREPGLSLGGNYRNPASLPPHPFGSGLGLASWSSLPSLRDA